MRAVPIPDAALRRAREDGTYADRVVIGEDDPTRDDVRPAEYLVRHSELYPGRLTFAALVALEDAEREAVSRGHRLWLTLDGAEVPWSIDVADLDTPDNLPDLARENALLRERLFNHGPYLLGKWADEIIHVDPCDCDEDNGDNEEAGDRCMANSDWSYAVLADEGGFAPSLVQKLPRPPLRHEGDE